MSTDGAGKPDFSDDAVFHQWFQENVWDTAPTEWSPERRERVRSECHLARKAIDSRTAAIAESKLDAILVWSGVAVGAVGAVIALPTATPIVPAVWGAAVGFVGLSISIAGAARAEVNHENAEQLLQRSRDLTQLQRAIDAAK